MRFSVRHALMCMAFVSCRVLDIPPPQSGQVRGRVEVLAPSGEAVPAVGATVRFVGTSIETTTNELGNFLIEPVLSAEGSVLVEYDPNHRGVPEKSRTFDFRLWKIAPAHDVVLGDVLLGDPAVVNGQVLLADVAEPSSQGGSSVVIAGTAAVTSTAFNGAFTLRGLPEGRTSLAVLRPGYQTAHVTPFEIRPGEVVTLAPVTLVPNTASGPGILAGRLKSALGAAVSMGVVDVRGPDAKHLTVDEDGSFELSLTPGLYEFRARVAEHSDLLLHNLVVSVGTTLALGDVILGAGTTSVEFPDAGGTDAGVLPEGCGDGRVTGAEVCDVGAPNGLVACSTDCRSLRVQGPGSVTCASVPLVAWTPTSSGDLVAAVPLASNDSILTDSSCGMSAPSLNIFDVVVDTNSVFSLNATPTLPIYAVRRTCADPATTLLCIQNGQSVGLTPGRYSLLTAFLSGGPRVATLALHPVQGPFCGDGVVSGAEECDPGGGAARCSATCSLVWQVGASTCALAPTVEWTPIAPSRRRARLSMHVNTSTGTQDPTASCAGARPDGFVRLDVPRPGTLTFVGVSSGPLFLGLWELNAGSCSPSLPPTACAGPSSGGRNVVSGATVDGGSFLLGIGALSPADGIVTMELDDR